MCKPIGTNFGCVDGYAVYFKVGNVKLNVKLKSVPSLLLKIVIVCCNSLYVRDVIGSTTLHNKRQ